MTREQAASALRQAALAGCITPWQCANANQYSSEDIATCKRIADRIATCVEDIRCDILDLNSNPGVAPFDPETARPVILDTLDAYISGDNARMIRAAMEG